MKVRKPVKFRCLILGQLVKTLQNTNEVSLESLPQGVYLLRVRDAEGTVYAKRVTVCR